MINGNLIRKERKNKGLSQTKLARMLGISQPMLSQIENGSGTSIKVLSAIASILSIPLDDIIEQPDHAGKQQKEASHAK